MMQGSIDELCKFPIVTKDRTCRKPEFQAVYKFLRFDKTIFVPVEKQVKTVQEHTETIATDPHATAPKHPSAEQRERCPVWGAWRQREGA
jgi:hypothetical protein